MQYAMLIYINEKSMNEEQREECYKDSARYAHRLNETGRYRLAAPLHPTATATTVRVRGDQRLVTDGPFAETREQLGGFFLVEARSLDEAIEIAAEIPAGRGATVEIRPMIDVPSLPKKSTAFDVDSEPVGST